MRIAKTDKGNIGWLVKRTDYLALADAAQGAKRWVTPFFILQVRPQNAHGDCAWRIGFTTSRKVGNAVVRNRARRRLREMVRRHLPGIVKPNHDIVFIGRTAAATVPFDKMIAALDDAAAKLKIHV